MPKRSSAAFPATNEPAQNSTRGNRPANWSHEAVLSLFRPVGTLNIDNSGPGACSITPVIPRDLEPCVYAWVRTASNQDQIIYYIGQTGQYLHERHYRHLRGFNESRAGIWHREKVRAYFELGWLFTVWCFHPAPYKFRDDAVPVHSSVEDFLIRVTQPTPEGNRESGKMKRKNF